MKEQINTTELDILPLREAMDYAQSLESRGDFKYKGIYAIFNAVFEATSRFQAHRILPDIYQLQKELAIPKDKFDEYINELTGRGSLKSLVLITFPAVDYIAGGGSLSNLTIVCRPTQQDGTSYKRYYDYYKNRSIDAFKKWIARKGSKWQGTHREYILKNLDDENYYNSHAGAVIHYYMQNILDKTQEQKNLTYKIFVKPVIQELINERVLLYLKGNNNFFTLQFPDEESLIDRMNMLIARLNENQPLEFPGEINQRNLENFRNKIQGIQINKNQLLFSELRLILNELIRIFKVKEEEQRKIKIQKVLEELSRYDWVIPANYLKSLNKDDLPSLISNPDVLHTEYMYGNKLMDFLLYKKNVYPAVVHARRQLADKGDDTEMKILMQMDVGRLLEGEQLKIYLSAEEEVLFLRLPWYIRIFRALFGKNRVKDEEKEKLKEEIRREEIEKQIHYKKKEAAKKTKELARKKIEENEEEKPQVDLYEEDVKKLKQTIQKDEKVEQIMSKVLDVLDEAWNNKELPNRLTLLERVEEFQNNEDYLIQFLKKYGRGKILSFRIKPNNPKSPKIDLNDPIYVWPILITKRYIIRHGHKLLKQAMDEADEQRNALMPDQEKFDIATSIEDFLTRILARKNK
ncbi:MAG: hypothetical protein KatS3mg129_2229 [Leptospiraceae bacterium]|nr:MAG: hypothetical protein KatS3mg129_2229 [Leptospiraceae bacterium]